MTENAVECAVCKAESRPSRALTAKRLVAKFACAGFALGDCTFDRVFGHLRFNGGMRSMCSRGWLRRRFP